MSNTKNKILISAILTIATCLTVIAGSTYALFTTGDRLNVAVTAANVEITATIDSEISTKTFGADQQDGRFQLGGTATFVTTDEDGAALEVPTLVVQNITPGDSLSFNIQITNSSNVTILYRIRWEVEGKLNEVLVANATMVTVNDAGESVESVYTLANGVSDSAIWTASEPTTKNVKVDIALPGNVGNDYQNKTASIRFYVEAIQGNADFSEFDNAQQPNG